MTEYKIRYNHLSRYKDVIAILVKYGFEDVLSRSNLKRFIPKRAKRKDGVDLLELPQSKRIRLAFEELGPTFIKFGQLLSTREDVLPKELIVEFEKLQDEVAPIEQFDVKGAVQTALNTPAEKLFDWIDEKPMASASIAQVHKAKLLSGELVILKVQRPNIKKVIYADLEIMLNLAHLLENNFTFFKSIQITGLVKSFERSIKKELLFRREGESIKRFLQYFKDDKRIKIPQPYKEFTTSELLCLEYVEGVKISNIQKLEELNFNRQKIAKSAIDLYYEQIFELGFFHADPHPGNVFVLSDGRLCFLDFGIMGSLLPPEQELLSQLMIQFLLKDMKGLIRTISQITGSGIDNTRELQYDLFELIEDVGGAVKDIRLGDVIDRFRVILIEHGIKIPTHFFLLMKTVIFVEGLVYRLNPEFNVIENLKPYAIRIYKRKLDPYYILKKFYFTIREMKNIMSTLPEDIQEIVTKMKEGRLKVEFEHKGLEKFYNFMELSSNRISIAIITAALIIGSSLIAIAKIPPTVFNISLIGLIGYIISGLFGFWIIISIIRRHRF